jgi:hypothetical protein
MILRFLAAVAFIGGGVVTWFILMTVKGYGASQAGMSAGAAHGPPDRDSLFMVLLCSYFLISACAALFCFRRRALLFSAALAYLVLFLTFLGMLVQNSADRTDQILTGVVTVGLIGFIYFTPWTILWFAIFLKCEKSGQQPRCSEPRNDTPIDNQGSVAPGP